MAEAQEEVWRGLLNRFGDVCERPESDRAGKTGGRRAHQSSCRGFAGSPYASFVLCTLRLPCPCSARCSCPAPQHKKYSDGGWYPGKVLGGKEKQQKKAGECLARPGCGNIVAAQLCVPAIEGEAAKEGG